MRKRIPPDLVRWFEADADQARQPMLFEDAETQHDIALDQSAFNVSRKFYELLECAAAHTDAQRWDLMYRMLWRVVTFGDVLLDNQCDVDVISLHAMQRQIRRDIHKMHAFVRFQIGEDGIYRAWYQPDFRIVELATPFFCATICSYALEYLYAASMRTLGWQGANI